MGPASLKRAYLQFLRATQPALPDELPEEFEIRTHGTGQDGWRALFGYDESEPAWAGDPADWDTRALIAGYEAIGHFDPTLQELLALVTVFAYSPTSPERPGSGTLYRGNGAMYINPHPSWSVGDVVETYVHELTHILLVLDEYRFGHYLDYDAMAEAENFLHTAILSRLQPLHLCFHSAVVACEILAARPQLDRLGLAGGLHGEADSLARSTARTINEMLGFERLDELMASRGRELLETLQGRFSEVGLRTRANAPRRGAR